MIFRRRRRDTNSAASTDHRSAFGDIPSAPTRQSETPDASMAGISDRIAMQILVLAEQQRGHLDKLEQEEQDPEVLKRLYEVDHAVTLMRRAARELRVLAEKDEPQLGGEPTPVLDVIRMAASSIESYTRLRIGAVPELAVLPYAADDVASLLAPLMDNATRYSPSAVDISAHATESGGVVIRVVDAGIGLSDEQLRVLNAAMAGTVPPVNELTSTHTGFPVVHRLARRHGVQVHFVGRPAATAEAGGGTTAVISLPAPLICEPPPAAEDVGEQGSASLPSAPAAAREAPAPPKVGPGPIGADAAPPAEPSPPQRPPTSALPRRESRSLRTKQSGEETSWASRPLAKDGDAAEDAPSSFAEDLDSFFGGAGSSSEAGSAVEDSEN